CLSHSLSHSLSHTNTLTHSKITGSESELRLSLCTCSDGVSLSSSISWRSDIWRGSKTILLVALMGGMCDKITRHPALHLNLFICSHTHTHARARNSASIMYTGYYNF